MNEQAGKGSTAPAVDPGRPLRVLTESLIQRFVTRPETGAVGGLVLVWSFFALFAAKGGFLTVRGTTNYLDVASEVGILGVAISLLLVAGEFDLSIGSMMGVTATIFAICVARAGLPVWVGVVAALGFALVYGFINGVLVVRTGLPSFLITLGGFFFLSGLSLAGTRILTSRTDIGGVDAAASSDPLTGLFAANLGSGFRVSILWWIALALLATWVLMRTPFGNWIFATGGGREQARQAGVPVDRVRIVLFMTTEAAAALVSIIVVLGVGQADPLIGFGKEFEALIVAVIGGALLSGGYGSVMGSILGALIVGIVFQGLFFAAVDASWYYVALGLMLLSAVVVNDFIQQRARRWR